MNPQITRSGSCRPGGPSVREDVCDLAELAVRLGLCVKTVRNHAAAGRIPGAMPGLPLRFCWAKVYESIAGPGIPDGEIVGVRELAGLLEVPEGQVRRAQAEGRISGGKIGGTYLFALKAVPRQLPARPETPSVGAPVAANARRQATGRISPARVARAIEVLGQHGVPVSPVLAEAARLRATWPDATFAELAGKADQVCTKNVISGRLRRLVAAAERVEAACLLCGGSSNPASPDEMPHRDRGGEPCGGPGVPLDARP